MTARIVLSDTKTAVTSYSSGPLNVGDLREFLVDIEVSAATGGTPVAVYGGQDSDAGLDYYTYTHSYSVVISRLTAFDTLVPLGAGPVAQNTNTVLSQPAANPPDAPERSIDALSYTGMISLITSENVPFGDRIQVDLINPEGIALTFTISIIGK